MEFYGTLESDSVNMIFVRINKKIYQCLIKNNNSKNVSIFLYLPVVNKLVILTYK